MIGMRAAPGVPGSWRFVVEPDARPVVMKKVLFSVAILTMLLSLAELLAFGFTRAYPKMFAPDGEALDQALNFDAYTRFLANRYDELVGWRNPQAGTATIDNCIGQSKHYSWDEHGARTTGAGGPVDVIVVGDSYTHGEEAGDSESYPYRLQEITGLGVANYGVNAFDPLQATLLFEQVVPRHPEARLAILGIMYENILRLPNAYRGIYSPIVQEPFSFKPFVEVTRSQAAFRGNRNAPPARSPEELRARVEAAIEEDYWRRPPASFPFLASVAAMLHSRLFLAVVDRKIRGSTISKDYQDPSLVHGLRHVVERFLRSARRHGLRPVVAFLPENQRDLTSPDPLIGALRTDHPDALFLNVGAAPLDWDRYNLNGTVCHPSPYGYVEIARYVAAAIAPIDRASPNRRTARAAGN
jgi:hypothetical protein